MVGGTILPSQGEGAISSLSSLGGHSCNVEREAEQLGTKSGGGEGSVHPLLLAMGGIAQNGKADLGCSNPSSPPQAGWLEDDNPFPSLPPRGCCCCCSDALSSS